MNIKLVKLNWSSGTLRKICFFLHQLNINITMNNKNINPVKTYTNADLDKLIIYRENKRSGIYR